MNNHAKLATAAGAFAVIGIVVAMAAFRTGVSARAENTTDSSRHHMHAAAPSPAVPEQGFYSEMMDVNRRMHEAMQTTPTGDFDRDFIEMMIPHHQGAIDMARVLLKYGHNEKLKRLAQSIIVEQDQEIAYMRTLQEALSRAAPTAHHAIDK